MKTNLLRMLGLFLLSVIFNNLKAQNFSLVKDIDTVKDSYPYNRVNKLYISFTPDYFPNLQYDGPFTVFKGVAYFTADDGIHGTELWRSDNTPAGTYMLKDINAGSAGTDIQELTIVGSKLFFTANRIVYETDGTAAGTVPVPGITYDGDATTCLTAAGNNLYFLTKVSRLWKTDGTEAGTSLVLDFRQVYGGQRDFLGQLTYAGGTLFFTTGEDNYNGSELWKSDGTAGGTVLVKDIFPGTEGSLPTHLTALGGKLYFTADDGYGRKLWVSDGTDVGTRQVVNTYGVLIPIYNVSYNADALPFASIGKVLYFKGYTSSTGDELYKYNADNAAAGIKLVKDIAAGAASPEPANLTAVGSNLYFTITAASNQQLYITDGTEGGTKLVKDLGTLTPYDVFNLAAANDKLLFTVFTPTNGNEPWKSDGTAVGTKMIKDIFPGYLSSLPQAFTYFKNGESLFSATDGKKGVELWKTDGTTAGTILLKNINTTTTGSSNPELRINTGVLNNKLFFSASNPQHPAALYLSDGTAAGTKMLDLNNGNSPGAADFTVFKNHIYFSAFGNGVVSVYKSDGTASGTKALFNAGSGALGVAKIIAAQDYFFVFYDDYDHNNTQLWVSDGTAAGSKLVQVIPFQSIYDGAATGNTICFSGYDAVHGSELWKATNAPGSAALLKDIVPGAQGSSISYFAVYNNKVYFTARDASNTAYIYLTNGTAAGTKKLFNTSVQQSPLVVANNKLFFTGNDATFGATLFCSSGTAATTKTVKDKIFGKPLSYPDYLTVFNNKVFCTASDSAYGTELFKTDGTNAGTTVVKDMVAGTYSSYPSQLTVGSGALYFRMSDASYYNQLWVTDGTAAGTQQVTDAAFTGITFNTMIGTSDKLFLNAYTYAYGYELYAGSASLQKPAISKASKNSMAGTGTFTATIMGNPITDRINLSVYNTKPQMCWITLADGAGKILFIKKEFIPAGVNSISYPAESLASGVYGLKITAADGSSVSLKIIK